MATTLTTDLEKFRPMLVAVARTLVSKRHSLDVDDLVQVGFLAIHRCAGKDTPGSGSFAAYARTRARYAMIDAIRDSGLIRVPRNYHGNAGSHLTGPAADAAHAMLARRIIGETQLGEDVLLAEIVTDDRPTPTFEEIPSMTRLNGFLDHPEPDTEPAADSKRCPKCARRYKNLSVSHCYYPDCDLFAGDRTKAKPKGKPGPKAKATSPAPTPVHSPAPASIAAELRLMGELSTLPPSSIARIVAWASTLAS
jgi:RNA polymerase sigma factor (sigma-70 family)